MTLLEASRRKVFAILLIFSAALLSSAAFFPSISMEGRLRLVETWSLRAASLFSAIVALFLAGYSLPGDFEQKRIYLLATKPASKGLIFLGKFVGFAILLAVFATLMGLVTVGFIRSIQLLAGPSFPALAAYPRLAASRFEGRGSAPPTQMDPGRDIRFHGGMHSWTFAGLGRGDFPETLRLETRLGLGSALQGRDRFEGTLLIRAVGPGNAVHEMRRRVNTNEERGHPLPAALIGAGGDLRIEIEIEETDGYISAERDSVALYQSSGSFEANYLRGMGLVFLQSLIVLSLTLMASTFVSAPLSILLGILLYLVGATHGFLAEGTRDLEVELSELQAGGRPHRVLEGDPPPWALRASTFLSRIALWALPDFDDFDFSRWLLKDRAVGWGNLGAAGMIALPRIAILLVVGFIVMTFRNYG
jgi:hypothetical protein